MRVSGGNTGREAHWLEVKLEAIDQADGCFGRAGKTQKRVQAVMDFLNTLHKQMALVHQMSGHRFEGTALTGSKQLINEYKTLRGEASEVGQHPHDWLDTVLMEVKGKAALENRRIGQRMDRLRSNSFWLRAKARMTWVDTKYTDLAQKLERKLSAVAEMEIKVAAIEAEPGENQATTTEQRPEA